MPIPAIRYLQDENQRGLLWRTVRQHNETSSLPLDVVRVGDPSAPPLGTSDPDLLTWCEASGRLLVSADKKTLPRVLATHLAAGKRSPGIFVVLPRCTASDVLWFLELAAYASDPEEWEDRIYYVR